jgi:hypothetical protein
MGKLHRMRHAGLLAGKNLERRIKSINEMTKEPEAEPNPPASSIVERQPQVPREEPTPEPVSLFVCEEIQPPVDSPTKGVPFDKLTSKSCRFIINNGDPRDFLFCGKPKRGKSYCEEHEAICYYLPIKKGPEDVKN